MLLMFLRVMSSDMSPQRFSARLRTARPSDLHAHQFTPECAVMSPAEQNRLLATADTKTIMSCWPALPSNLIDWICSDRDRLVHMICRTYGLERTEAEDQVLVLCQIIQLHERLQKNAHSDAEFDTLNQDVLHSESEEKQS